MIAHMLLQMVCMLHCPSEEKCSLQVCISSNPLAAPARSIANNFDNMEEEFFVDWEVNKVSSWLLDNGLPLSVCDIFEGNFTCVICWCIGTVNEHCS